MAFDKKSADADNGAQQRGNGEPHGVTLDHPDGPAPALACDETTERAGAAMALYDQHGLVALPARPDAKGAIHPPFRYVHWYDKKPTRGELSALWAGRESQHDQFILTGEAHNLLVIDVDSPEAHAALRARVSIPETTPCETTRKGWHYYFKWPAQLAGVALRGTNAGLLGAGLDVLSNHAGVHAGPAVHKPRAWIAALLGGSIPEAPTTLVEWIMEQRNKKGSNKHHGASPPPSAGRPPPASPGDAGSASAGATDSPSDAYRFAHIPGAEGGRHAAALALTGALSGAGARPDRVLRVLRAANARHEKPTLPDEEIVRMVDDVITKDAEKRDEEEEDATGDSAPEPPKEGKGVGRQAPQRKRSAAKAVMALLRACVVNPQYTPSSHQLRGIWLLSGTSVCWSVCNASRLAMEMVDGGFGGLRAFALDLDPRARDIDVVNALQLLTKHAERQEDDPMSERLICAALAMPVLRHGDKDSGIQLERPLSAEPGVYPEHGVSLKRVAGVWTLAMHLPNAAVFFSKHPDLGFGRRSSDELVRILMSSARKVTRKKNVALPGVSYHLDVADLMNPTDDDAASSESKQGGGVASDDSDDTTKAKAPPR